LIQGSIIIRSLSTRSLYRDYRNIDRPTDVISFALEDNEFDVKLFKVALEAKYDE
jgi:ssRNA-specific RNase YbeY (16S rRNA maturation enzyme)